MHSLGTVEREWTFSALRLRQRGFWLCARPEQWCLAESQTVTLEGGVGGQNNEYWDASGWCTNFFWRGKYTESISWAETLSEATSTSLDMVQVFTGVAIFDLIQTV